MIALQPRRFTFDEFVEMGELVDHCELIGGSYRDERAALGEELARCQAIPAITIAPKEVFRSVKTA